MDTARSHATSTVNQQLDIQGIRQPARIMAILGLSLAWQWMEAS